MYEFNNKDFLKYIMKTNIPSSEVNYLIKLYKNYKKLSSSFTFNNTFFNFNKLTFSSSIFLT